MLNQPRLCCRCIGRQSLARLGKGSRLALNRGTATSAIRADTVTAVVQLLLAARGDGSLNMRAYVVTAVDRQLPALLGSDPERAASEYFTGLLCYLVY